MPLTWKKAEAAGLAQKTDVKTDYTGEMNTAMHKAIARAWSDPQYKKDLIANPTKHLAELGVHYPDQYNVEFFDDPSAKVGDWSMSGKNQTSTIRVPIPAAPAGGHLSTDDLKMLAAAADDCCCCCGLCTCTGAASQDTWY
jgi:hypothetical protein